MSAKEIKLGGLAGSCFSLEPLFGATLPQELVGGVGCERVGRPQIQPPYARASGEPESPNI